MAITTVISTASSFAISMVFGVVGLNAPQKYRPALNAGLILTSVLAFRNITDANLGLKGTDTIAMFVLFYISHMTCALCMEKYVLPNKYGASFEWWDAYKMLFNARFIGTYREAPDVQKSVRAEIDLESPREPNVFYPTYPTTDFKAFLRSPCYHFLRNRAVSLLVIYAIDQFYNYLYNTVLPQYVEPIDIYDMLPSKQMYFRRLATVTMRETIIRLWIVVHWTWSSYSLYTSLHHFLALLFVGVGLDNHEDWPSLYGNIFEATSIRGFWGKFWHRLVYRSYTSYGKFISLNILRLPRNSIIGKLFVNGFVFILSGLVHGITLRQLGFSCGAIDELKFYCSHYLAILAETAVHAVFKKLNRGYKTNRVVVSNTIGYIWVFGFLFYSLPKSQYGRVFCVPK
jgi:hypothetical protein